VSIDDTNLEANQTFWENFLKLNLKYQTVPFGGHNPVFVPGVTDEKDYEDTYIHNQQQFLQKQSRTPVTNVGMDVNYL
jgi:hypothetical protein